MKNWIIKGFLLTVLLALNTGCVLHSTGSTEVGVRTQKLAFLGNQGVEQRIYSPGSTYFFIPIINDWHTFDTKLQNLEMTFASNQGDLLERDDLRFKTIDGNDISMDVIISYRIIPKMAPYILEHIARNDDELRTKIVRTVTRSRPRDIFGELETELFYTAENRSLKSESA
ncbi:MAG: regulator of protease activity HflC (stomatin/prohibitin superfamily), partial [Candidatus Marinamargulisbacteria bacterium]